ncbi:MAG: FTR1 family protein [Alphaproteobacteria bacterium]|nr:FTR1 family protein [Alphaproteobacteria bacterium]MBV9061315.1 FTR1 family protein [Alphaproteobacteria bacterium]
MVAALIIVFREVIEAGLIVGIVLAATRGVESRGRWVLGGVMAGVVGACGVAAFTGEIANLFSGAGQELFNASILFFAVAMLTWHNVWMAGHGREMARSMKEVGSAVSAGDQPLMALAAVVGVAVLREGSEVVLFLYGIGQGASPAAILSGSLLGLMAGIAISLLMYFGLLAIPPGKLFRATAWLITLLAAGMASQAILFLQNAGYVNALARSLWDTSWLLPDGGEGMSGVLGKMLHTLVGYTAAPDGAQLLAYAGTIVAIVGLTRWERTRQPKRNLVLPHPA